jgi:hypothetical protein
VTDGATRPPTLNVAVPLAARLTVVAIDPDPEVTQVEPALATHVHVTPVSAAGTTSVTDAPATSLGPLLVTTIVQVTGSPAATAGEPGGFVTARSAMSDGADVTSSPSFAGFGSTGVLD